MTNPPRRFAAGDLAGMAAPFPRTVAHHGVRYTLLEPPTPDQARLTFTGPFESREVIWDTTLLALPRSPSTDLESPRPDYIDVGDASELGRRLTVALAVPAIDNATLLRTIIMIRQYRRLRRGRHEFSQASGR